MRVTAALTQAKKNILQHLAVTHAGIITTGFSLIILGSFILVYQNIIRLSERFFEVGQYSIFLKENTDSKSIYKITNLLKKSPHIDEVKVLKPKKIWNDFKKHFHDQEAVLNKINLRSLPGIIEFRVTKKSKESQILLKKLKKFSWIQEIITGKETHGQIANFFTIANFIGTVFVCLLSISIYFIIGNSIKISIHSRINEVETLEILGATPSFIRMPYIFEGIYIALSGLLFSIVSVFILYKFIIAGITFDKSTYIITKHAHFFDFTFLIETIFIMIFIGAVSSIRATNQVMTHIKQ